MRFVLISSFYYLNYLIRASNDTIVTLYTCLYLRYFAASCMWSQPPSNHSSSQIYGNHHKRCQYPILSIRLTSDSSSSLQSLVFTTTWCLYCYKSFIYRASNYTLCMLPQMLLPSFTWRICWSMYLAWDPLKQAMWRKVMDTVIPYYRAFLTQDDTRWWFFRCCTSVQQNYRQDFCYRQIPRKYSPPVSFVLQICTRSDCTRGWFIRWPLTYLHTKVHSDGTSKPSSCSDPES